ncbi:MAG: hypothetical protein ACWA5Q_01880 [bacterium]
MNKVLQVAVLLTGGMVHAVAQAEYQLQPINTHYAQTLTEVTVDGWFESFSGVELDELEDFDGWTTGIDLTLPFLERFQISLSLPLRTEGDAVAKEHGFLPKGDSTSVEGNGGVFDYPSVTFAHQLMNQQEDGYNLSYYVGGGSVLDSLDTELVRAQGAADQLNHNGKVFFAGIRMDGDAFGHRTLGNFGLRYYPRSDDIFPGSLDEFTIVDIRGAVVFDPWGARLYPVVELTYLGDFGDMNQITLIPEVLYPISENLEFKAGAAIGLGGNGNEFGGQAELSIRF